jgi:hypothetical protein
MGDDVEHRFDSFAKTLAEGSHTRGRVVKAGVALVGAAVAGILPGRARGANPNGNDTCAHFCNMVFPAGPLRGQCKSAAAHGAGLCFECGPMAPVPHTALCVNLCCGVGEICCNQKCVSPVCTGGHVFNATTCKCECPPALPTECSGVCVNTADSDNANCGACGHACTGGQSCVNGQCVCPTGTALCGGTCVSTTCSGGQVFNPTTCTCECAPGTFACGTTCCNAGDVCTNGHCEASHPECNSATCATFTQCSSGNPDCVCASVMTPTGPGVGICVPGSTQCAGLAACGGASGFECPTGSVCAVNTCCVSPVCVPIALAAQCPTGTARALVRTSPLSSGPTLGGG